MDTLLSTEVRADDRPAEQLYWSAHHLHGKYLALSGRESVRAVVGSLDGLDPGWPWTIIAGDERGGRARFFQVLGDATELSLEVGGAEAEWVLRVARTGVDTARLHPMPPDLAFWCPAVMTDELHDAETATDIGLRWIVTGELPAGCESRPV